MRTGRPRQFDVDEARNRAMDAFWRRAYDGATLDELTAALGSTVPACTGRLATRNSCSARRSSASPTSDVVK
jgi:hypothetical protein